ncbi:MAG: arsenate reductase ArsC [Ilumatobacteraceae bacterium]|nr:arsenate reductase ArsC [Ilumatobacteraceae bacterium]
MLFLCVHNAGRSQMAAGFVRALNRPDIHVWSGGSEPRESINTAAVTAMAELGIDISRQIPQRWDASDLDQADVIITMGCGDTCPIVAGKRYEDWQLPDPAGQPLEFVRTVRDQIKTLVDALIETL